MPFGNLGGWSFVIILIIVLLLFGAPKLPQLAKSLGESMRIFKGEMSTMKKESSDRASAASDAYGSGAASNEQSDGKTPPSDTPPSNPQADGNDTPAR